LVTAFERGGLSAACWALAARAGDARVGALPASDIGHAASLGGEPA
jgi:hypothetical protein